MTKFIISILNLKLVHKKQIEDLENRIEELQQQIELIQKSYDKIYDV